MPVSSELAAAASQERAAAFIARWKASSGSERSNYISFLNELTDLLEVPRPDPATADNARNAYVFERAIEMTQRGTTGYIDLYKRGCFVCETKQGIERDEEQAALSDKLRERRRAQRKGHGIRGTAGFDQVLIKARNQAEGYARNLPVDEGRPPFLIVADVGPMPPICRVPWLIDSILNVTKAKIRLLAWISETQMRCQRSL